ncbi:hypothetical protein RHS04_08132 [Rhizoctonia solani]|uniref:Uncharacterized protein n=1 Tax=Rhizoctonia solani TaxID=456999 RepID=A0A8H7LG13_9AGAM|nr:hypothetical protein RHS04_08132 [Rhizoctonia solani]
MLKSLLTPLKTRFEEAVSLRSNDTPDAVPESPEDFERDARAETMRMVVQSINAVEDDTARIDVSRVHFSIAFTYVHTSFWVKPQDLC